jgi:SAM-dependent methyltransferase
MKTAEYWNGFYGKKELVHEPSPFAKWCMAENWINSDSNVLELGCGNGRDAFCFIHHDIHTVAIDASAVAIEQNIAQAEKDHRTEFATFISLDFNEIDSLKSSEAERFASINTIYSRFVLRIKYWILVKIFCLAEENFA